MPPIWGYFCFGMYDQAASANKMSRLLISLTRAFVPIQLQSDRNAHCSLVFMAVLFLSKRNAYLGLVRLRLKIILQGGFCLRMPYTIVNLDYRLCGKLISAVKYNTQVFYEPRFMLFVIYFERAHHTWGQLGFDISEMLVSN